jgi:phage-related minor tail protein
MAFGLGKVVATVSALVVPELDAKFGQALAKSLNAEADKATDKLGQNLGKKLSGIGNKLTLGITGPLVAIGTLAVNAGIELDAALDSIRAKTGLTGEAFATLEKDFKAVNLDTTQNLDRVAEVLGTLYNRTKLSGPALQDVARQVLQLEEISGKAVNADALGQLFQAYSLQGPQAAESLNQLLRATQYSGVSTDELIASLTNLKPVFSQIGLSFEEATALTTSFAKAGIDADSVLQAVGRAAAKSAKDGKPFNQVFEGTLKQITDLVKQGKDTEALNLATTLFGGRGAVKALEAIKAGTFDLAGALQAVGDSNVTIESTVAGTRDFGEQLTIFRKQASVSLGELGTKLFPVIQQAIETLLPPVISLIDSFTALDPTTQGLIVKGAALAAALGPVASITGKLTTAFTGVSKLAPLATKALSGIQAGFSALLSMPPMAWGIILGIAAVAAIVVLIIKNWDKIKAAFVAVGNAIKAAWSATLRFLGSIVSGAVDFIKRNWAVILGIITGPIGAAVIIIIKNWDTIKAAVQAAVAFIGSIVQAGASFLATAWSVVFDIITAPFRLAQAVVEGVFNAIKAAAEWLADALDAALGPLDEIISKGASLVGSGIGWVADTVTGKAVGGPVTGGKPYIVGEKGPELMVPRTSGTIIPNNALGTAGAATYNITVVNPTAEPTSTSIPTALRRAAQLRG